MFDCAARAARNWLLPLQFTYHRPPRHRLAADPAYRGGPNAYSSGAVVLTRNEWIEARRPGREYWLLRVYADRCEAISRQPVVQDPARKLRSPTHPPVEFKGYRLPGDAILRTAPRFLS